MTVIANMSVFLTLAQYDLCFSLFLFLASTPSGSISFCKSATTFLKCNTICLMIQYSSFQHEKLWLENVLMKKNSLRKFEKILTTFPFGKYESLIWNLNKEHKFRNVFFKLTIIHDFLCLFIKCQCITGSV